VAIHVLAEEAKPLISCGELIEQMARLANQKDIIISRSSIYRIKEIEEHETMLQHM
jgi:hypothetical protein